jgi:hypothetical protein
VSRPRAGADAVGEAGYSVEDVVDLIDDVDAVHDERRSSRQAQRDVENGAVLRDVDPITAKHRLDPFGKPRLLRQLDQEVDSLVGDPVLRVVEVETSALGGEPFAPRWVAGEQIAQMKVADLCIVLLQRHSGGAVLKGEGRAHRHSSGSGAQRRALLVDVGHEVVPGVDEAVRRVRLELGG